MGAISVIGAQWGDEGKGKIVALAANGADAVVRYHGGNNAGHTLYHNGVKFASHLVPSGVFNPKAKLYIGRGAVLNLAVLNKEIADLKAMGIDLAGRLSISPACNVIMPYHQILDTLYEEAKGGAKTGTTGRGIGPCHASKVSYNGIRLHDFLQPNDLIEKVKLQLKIQNQIIVALGGRPLVLGETTTDLLGEYYRLALHISEPRSEILEMLKSGKNVLFEGAHGVLLDNDWGTYPFVSASGVVSGYINGGSGVPLRYIDRVIGVTKAYETRVGNGPMPTELNDDIGAKLQSVGGEVGTTTARIRRCGWLDLVLLKYAVEVAGINELAVTKLDILDSFEEIKVCTDYVLSSGPLFTGEVDNLSASELAALRPTYRTFKGWKKETRSARTVSDLPAEAIDYLGFIVDYLGVPISIISVGPNDEDTVLG